MRVANRSSTPASLAGRDRDVEAAAHERCLAVRRVDCLREQPELVVERSAVGVDRRRKILREELELEPPVAADDAEPAALPCGSRTTAASQSTVTPIERGVMLNDLPPATNVTGTAASRAERRSSSVARLVRGEPADVDARDPRACSEPVGRTGEEERRRRPRATPLRAPGSPSLVQKRDRATERPRTAEDEASHGAGHGSGGAAEEAAALEDEQLDAARDVELDPGDVRRRDRSRARRSRSRCPGAHPAA